MGTLIRTAVGVALTGALLSACGSGDVAMDSPGADPARMSAESMPMDDSSTVQMGEQVIRTANVSLVVDTVDDGMTEVKDLITAVGGFVQNQSISTYDGVANAMLTARVPATELDAFLEDIAALGEVTNSSIDAQDVTLEVVDLEARIRTLEDSIARLRELQGQATSVADLVAVEAELANRQAELESLEARRDYLARQVDMSTVYISITQQGPGPAASPDFLGGLQTGWSALVSLGAGLITSLGFMLPFLLVGGLITGVVLIIVATARRRDKAQGKDRP